MCIVNQRATTLKLSDIYINFTWSVPTTSRIGFSLTYATVLTHYTQTNLGVESRQSTESCCCCQLRKHRSKNRCCPTSLLQQNETLPSWTECCCQWCAVGRNCFVVDKLFELQTVSGICRWSRDKCWRHCNIDWTPHTSLGLSTVQQSLSQILI